MDNREIKFRVWLDGVMHHVGDRLVWFEENFVDTYKDAHIMQYTGLKDKNGVEIYEGDIVHILHPHQGRTYTGEIIFQRGAFIGKEFWFSHHDDPADIWESLEYIEVIGNIYETKATV